MPATAAAVDPALHFSARQHSALAVGKAPALRLSPVPGIVGSMAEPTWHDRELPILEALAATEDRNPFGVSLDEVADQAGMTRERAAIAVAALIDDGYIAGNSAHDQAGDDWLGLRLRGDGRRAIRQWPAVDDAGEALVAVLEQRRERRRTRRSVERSRGCCDRHAN